LRRRRAGRAASPQRPRNLDPAQDLGSRAGLHQGTGPKRSMYRPVPAVGGSVARVTIASVPSVTVWVPRCPLKSVAVEPGSAALNRTSGSAFAYCMVSMVTAALEAV